jgi:hypothetical protein
MCVGVMFVKCSPYIRVNLLIPSVVFCLTEACVNVLKQATKLLGDVVRSQTAWNMAYKAFRKTFCRSILCFV